MADVFKSKFGRIVKKNLSAITRQRFRDYLATPLFKNTSPRSELAMQALLNRMEKYPLATTYNDEDWKEDIHQLGLEIEIGRFDRVKTDLMTDLENFMLIEAKLGSGTPRRNKPKMHPISNLEVLARMAYASSLETIGLDSEAKAEISDLRKEIEEEVFLDSHHPYFTFLLQERLLTAKRDSLELFESEEIHVAFQAIEKFSLLQKFRLACVIADGTFKKNASHALPQPSILLEIKDLPDDPLLKCYQCCLELLQLQVQLSTPEKKKHEQMKASVWIDLDVYADRLESLLEAIRKSHASIDLIDLYQHLINYQIRQINLGRAENDRKSRLYHLYQRFLDIPPIEKNPSNRIFIFKNMGSLLVSLGDTETLKRLIDEQSTNFNDHPSYVLDLVKGMSAFYHRQYEIAEDHFFNVLKSSILNFNLDARGYQALIQVLEAKILDPDFTQGHLHATYEQVETHLRQFHNYLMDLQKKHSK